MAAGDGTYVYTSNSEPSYVGKGQKPVDAVDAAAAVGGRDPSGSSAPRTFAVGVIGLWIVAAICEIGGAHWLSGFDDDHNQVLPVLAWVFLMLQLFALVAHLKNNTTLMSVNLALLVALNVAMVITIMCYSFKKPKTELEHDIYDKPKVRAGVIAVSCSHVVLWAVQMLACIRHRNLEMRIQEGNM